MVTFHSGIWFKVQGLVLVGSIAAGVGLSGSAFADQCAYVSQEVAQRAAEIIATRKKAADFCEPCGDTVPTSVYKIKDVVAAPAGYENFWQVLLNGQDDYPTFI